MFRKFFSKGSGLGVAEFRAVCRQKFGLDISSPNCQLLFDKIDTDGNGTVDVGEFMDFIKRQVGPIIPQQYCY